MAGSVTGIRARDGSWIRLGDWVQRLDEGGEVTGFGHDDAGRLTIEFRRRDGTTGRFVEIDRE